MPASSARTASAGSRTARSPPISPSASPRPPPSSCAGPHRRRAPRCGQAPVAVVARDPRVSGEFISAAVAAGLAQLRRRRLRRRRHPDPGRRVPHRRHRRRLRRDGLGVAQPGARQRHQDLRRAAARSSPTSSRTASRHAMAVRKLAADRRPGSAASAGSRTPKTATSCTCSAVAAAPPRRDPRRPRLRARRGGRRLARGVHATPAHASP